MGKSDATFGIQHRKDQDGRSLKLNFPTMQCLNYLKIDRRRCQVYHESGYIPIPSNPKNP